MRNKDVASTLRRPESDIEKLPKWSQDLIRLLDMRLEEARTEINRRQGGVTPETKVIADLYGRSENEAIPLRKDTTVRFISGDENRGEYFDVHLTDDELRVSAGNLIQIAPGGSNTIYCIAKR